MMLRKGMVCFALAAALCGCDKGSGVAGSYVNDKKPGDVTELKKDGGCVVKQGTATLTGNYTVEGKTVTIKLASGDLLKGSIEGKTLIDNEGEHWSKR